MSKNIPPSTEITHTNNATGSVIRTLYDKLQDTVSVKDFGAVGDGVTDDTAAIQAALTSAVTNNTGLVFPTATYLVLSTITLSIPVGRTLHIDGNGSVINTTIADSTVVYSGFITISGTSGSSLILRDLSITSNQAGAVSTSRARGFMVGLAISTLAKIEFDGVSVSGFGFINIWLYKVLQGVVLNCSGINSRYAGLFMQSCADINVIGGAYGQNGGLNGSTVEGYGVTCATKYQAADLDNIRIKIDGTTCSNNIGKGIDAHDCLGLIITNNSVIGFIYNGIYAVNEGGSKNVSSVVINNNYIDGTSLYSTSSGCSGIQAGAYGATATATNSFVICSNRISNISASTAINYGIQIENGAGVSVGSVVIAENTIFNGSVVSGYPIFTNSSATNIGDVIIANNAIYQTVTSTGGIIVGNTNRVVINGNSLSLTSAASGIYDTVGADSSITNNIVRYSGVVTTPILEFFTANHTRTGNIVNGVALADTNISIPTLTTTTSLLSPRVGINHAVPTAQRMWITSDVIGEGGLYVSGTGTSGYGIYGTHTRGSYAILGYYNGTTDYSLYGNGNIFSGGSVAATLATTAAAANMYSSADGANFLRSTSSIRYKRDVETMDQAVATNILNLRPVWYRSKAGADNSSWSYYGLIAEEVAQIEPRLVHWSREKTKQILIQNPDENASPEYRNIPDEESKLIPDGVQYERLSVMLLSIIQEQERRISSLEAK